MIYLAFGAGVCVGVGLTVAFVVWLWRSTTAKMR